MSENCILVVLMQKIDVCLFLIVRKLYFASCGHPYQRFNLLISKINFYTSFRCGWSIIHQPNCSSLFLQSNFSRIAAAYFYNQISAELQQPRQSVEYATELINW